MADDVQGFNHLDEVLMHLGDQFRQEALKQQMLKNQNTHYENMGHGSGAYDNKPFAYLQKEAMRLTGVHQQFIHNTVEGSKDVTGVPTISPDQAEQMWQNTPEAGEMQEVNGAVIKGITQMNPTLMPKPQSTPVSTPTGTPVTPSAKLPSSGSSLFMGQ